MRSRFIRTLSLALLLPAPFGGVTWKLEADHAAIGRYQMLASSVVPDRLLTGDRSRPAVLFLFATWCKYSAYEGRYVLPPFLRYLRDRHASFLGVDETSHLGVGTAGPLGHPERGVDALSHLRRRPTISQIQLSIAGYQRHAHIRISVIADPDMRVGLHYPLYFHQAYPTFIFLASDGTVVTRSEGVQSLTALETTFRDVALYGARQHTTGG